MNQTFNFLDYEFDAAAKQLQLHYGYDELRFTESYRFDFEFAAYDPAALDRAIQLLFLIAGVSYYKLYAPPAIAIHKGQVDAQLSRFLSKTYQKGLGEFFYVNQLDPHRTITFPVNHDDLLPLPAAGSGAIVGIGGGKDSLVSIEILRRHFDDLATWSVNHRPQLTPLVKRVGLPHYWVERTWDAQLQQLNAQPGTYNGHVPISAIFAAVGTIVAILAGRQYSIVSNEQSANEPTLVYQGLEINHQYSKSQQFETDFQQQLHCLFGPGSLSYFSFLRPLSELHIAELFAVQGFQKYHDVFSSCNRAFVHGSQQMFWDGQCAKCAFVFLALTPFVERSRLERLFNSKNLLLDDALQPTYRQLLGIAGDKPLDCVGEIKESRTAMRLAKDIYPELSQYQFDIPEDYDFRAFYVHQMPETYAAILRNHLKA